jgi:predicted DCC family thiol-disulfide oxidoreductase YuxK
MGKLWDRLFLEERPSIGLSFFRIAVALTTGFHVIPAFFHLEDTFYHTAFKTMNPNFFPRPILELVSQSPDPLVLGVVILFCAAWFFFLIGFFAQLSCIVMTLGCYYFYALNAFVVGALSWDILLVTLFLMCLTPFHGDYFSVDAMRGGDPHAYQRRRPYFIQRLLQMQIAFTFFYTGLIKITGPGNWLKDNPIYYLMNYPMEGVTKMFLLREFFAQRPELCYNIGVLIVGIELAMPFLLFYPRTRTSAIYLGIFFHLTLLLAFDVPAIFFFLFPAQLLLFIHPDKIVRWIEQKRVCHQQDALAAKLVFDGHCQFCQANVRAMKVIDLFAALKYVDYQTCPDIKSLHPQLTQEAAHSQVHLVEPDGNLWGGFFAFRRLCWKMPMLYPLIPLAYFPGSGVVGPAVYKWVAKNRYLFHLNKTCRDNACFIKH